MITVLMIGFTSDTRERICSTTLYASHNILEENRVDGYCIFDALHGDNSRYHVERNTRRNLN